MEDFQTDRLIIRPTHVTDAALLVELMNSPGWLRFIGDRQVYAETAAVQYINEKINPQFERLGYGNYTIIRKLDGVKVGTCGLFDRDGIEGIDIGYALLPAFFGQGYAFEAVSQVKDLAFGRFNLDVIHAITAKENVVSQQLLRKLGFLFQSFVTLPHKAEEIMLFSAFAQKSSHAK